MLRWMAGSVSRLRLHHFLSVECASEVPVKYLVFFLSALHILPRFRLLLPACLQIPVSQKKIIRKIPNFENDCRGSLNRNVEDVNLSH